jgi:ribonuclease Y
MSFFNNLSNIFNTPPSKKVVAKVKAVIKPSAQNKAAQPTPEKVFAGKTQPVQPAITPKVTAQPPVDPRALADAQSKADALVREAQSKAREIIVEAKDEALAIRGKAEKQEREVVRALEDQQRDLNNKLDKIDLRLSQIDDKEARLEQQRSDLDKKVAEIEASKQEVMARLEKVSGMTKDQASALLMDGLEKRLSRQMAQFVKQKEEEAQATADEKVQEILVDAMKHGATDYVAEYTISTVTLPHEEAKGKIIGKSGRNIHAFEKVTGVDVDLDGSPTEVRLSCFDPVRREIARISLERLIKDGRIQPTRIEEVVDKVRGEIDKITFEAGKKLCHDVGIYNLPTDLMKMLGKFKYRFSYGQNLIGHTLEETKIGIKLAHELKADVNIVKLGCLLHDIGKVSDEVEGSHVELGVKIAKKYGMPQPVIDCIAQHHEDEAFTGTEQMIVYIADAISGSRPGARYENYDEYVQRLQKLEEIAMAYAGVKQAYAIQAGREIRVMLDPEVSADDDVIVLATKIRDEVKEKMTYPGTVTVNVSRETRAMQVAA